MKQNYQNDGSIKSIVDITVNYVDHMVHIIDKT